MSTTPSFEIAGAFDKFIRRPKADKPVVTARLENLEEGVCPYCKQQMLSSEAAGIPVWVCHSDRAVSPKLNSSDPATELTIDLKPTISP